MDLQGTGTDGPGCCPDPLPLPGVQRWRQATAVLADGIPASRLRRRWWYGLSHTYRQLPDCPAGRSTPHCSEAAWSAADQAATLACATSPLTRAIIAAALPCRI